jgi:poly-gamma-glutamate synthesis protein (capsule biosynthesis protein)
MGIKRQRGDGASGYSITPSVAKYGSGMLFELGDLNAGGGISLPGIFFLTLLLSSFGSWPPVSPQEGPFPSLYQSSDVFSTSIEAARCAQVAHRKVSGLTVPHHLLAADLIARAFCVAERNRYDKIVILFPDHFKKTRHPFATTKRSFATVYGMVPTNEGDASHLLADAQLVEQSDLFARDHGIGAVLPYVRHFFPNVPIVPIAVSIKSTRDNWERLVADIDPLITANTLILQSTDFSHYLTHHEAIEHDQQVLNILSANDLNAVAKLIQPAHLDSRGSQYIQMRLQAKHFHGRPIPILNSNSQLYSAEQLQKTTSYIVQIYSAEGDAGRIDPPDPSAAKLYCFAGDTFFGRFVRKLLANAEAAERLRKELVTRLAGCPLIVNLEGVMVDEVPPKLEPLTLAMPRDLTLDWLKSLHVVAVSVANNHANDLGSEALAKMEATLEANGIKVLRHGDIDDFGSFRVVALTDLDNKKKPFQNRIGEDDLQRIGRSDALPPLIAFLHWGKEYEDAPDARQTALADSLRRDGVSLIVGAHSHRALPNFDALAGGQTGVAYGLGNFIFDQFEPPSSDALLEVRFFPQGTFFARLVPMPDFYQMAHRPAQ